MKPIRFCRQETRYTCGAACMRMAIECCGIKKSEKQVARLLSTNKVSGTKNRSFPVVAEMFRLNHLSLKNAAIDDLRRYQQQGYVIIVSYLYKPENVGHYAIMKKVTKKNIYFWDPYIGQNHKYPLPYFKKIWKSDPKFDNERRWLFAAKKP